MDKISICIPTWNRVDSTIESFFDVYDDNRIGCIVIVDDASTDGSYEKLKSITDYLSKVRLYRNDVNQDCYKNKMISVSHCPTDYCILLDSDNKISTSYIDKIYNEIWDEKTILTPDFAMPNFDFRAYSGMVVSRKNVADYIDKPMFEVMCNAANYFVSKKQYLKVFDKSIDPVTSDSIFQFYNWLKEDGKVKIVSGMQYDHKVHDGSHYQNNLHKTPQGFHNSILQKIRELK